MKLHFISIVKVFETERNGLLTKHGIDTHWIKQKQQ